MSRREVRQALQEAAGGNMLERAIGAVAPVWAAKRQQARMFMALAGGYTGASRGRRQTSAWKYTRAASADADTLVDLPELRDRSRDLIRNEPLACGAIAGAVTSVVGTGLALQSRVDREALDMTKEQAEAWQKNTEREWRLLAHSTAIDATRTHDFYGLQALVFRAAMESGDTLATAPMRAVRGQPYELCLQVFEADQCSNPNGKTDTNQIAGGVELDRWGAPVAYHLTDVHPGALNRGAPQWTRYAAFGERTGRRQVIHLYDKLRPGLTRGVPWLAPVIETLKMLGRYTEAELMAAVISGMFTVFIESERGGLDPNDASGIGAETGASGSDKDVKMGVGTIVDLNKGEKISTANPGRPNPAFEGFVVALCRFVGIALEIPYEVLIKHFASSYSASRGALLEAWKFYYKRRAWLAQGFCEPVYELWMDEAVAKRRIAAPGYFDDPLLRRAYLGAEWVGDGPISLDPGKDIDAAVKRMDACVSTLQKESALHDGGDWKDNITQRGLELAAIEEAGAGTPPPNAPAPPETPPAPVSPDSGGGTDLEEEDGAQEKNRPGKINVNSQTPPNTGNGHGMVMVAESIHAMAAAVSRQQPPVFNVEHPVYINVPEQPAPRITVESPVHVHVPKQSAQRITVESPVHVHVPTQPAPLVNVDVNVPEQPAPQVNVAVEAPKPWATETVIKKRDEQGRADVMQTRPIK